MNLTSPGDIASFLKERNLSPLKKFGQNFLCDRNIVDKIVRGLGVPEGGYALEIGTGLGALTAALAERAGRVVSVEIDRGLLAAHAETLVGYENVTVVEGDILTADIAGIGREYFSGARFSVCGNLPYYITSKILLRVLESGAPIDRLVVMVQKEVAQRLCAQPGDTDYGALTVSCRYFADPKTLFGVSRNCFYPAPEVDSAVLSFDLSRPPLPADRGGYVKVVRAGFSMRRKTLFNNLKRAAPPAAAADALERCGLLPGARAQDVSPAQFARLAGILFPAE